MFFTFQHPLRGSTALLAVGSRVLNIDIPPKSPFGKGGLRQGSRSPKGYKKRKTFRSSFSVPLDVLFSKEFQDDLIRIWNLRYLIPDPEIYNKDTSQPTFH